MKSKVVVVANMLQLIFHLGVTHGLIRSVRKGMGSVRWIRFVMIGNCWEGIVGDYICVIMMI